MKKLFQRVTLTTWILILCNCSTNTTKSDDTLFYLERELPFTDLKYFRIKDNDWIRNPINILTVHETLKKIGYSRFITSADLETTQMLYNSPEKEYLNIPLGVKIDSLVLTYSDFDNATRFYKEFWHRRVKERNDKAVFTVLTEVREILLNKKVLPVNDSLVNDTLFRLVTFDIDTSTNATIAVDYFNYLKSIGLHQSAHNLLFENYRYQDLELDRDGLNKTLTRTNVFYDEPWIPDDTK